MTLNHWSLFFKQDHIRQILAGISQKIREHSHKKIFPPKNSVFRAFQLCGLEKVKVIILGQDPYHGENQADGLAFSVPQNQKLPPSLQNIFRELETDLGIKNISGDLSGWARQGVLLLNSVLTVNQAEPASHKQIGWEIFTDEVIKHLAQEKSNLVFLLWGNFAISKKSLISEFNARKPDHEKHLILTAPHPSPYSAHSGFFGCRHFSKTNEFLKSKNLPEINWKN